MASSSSTVPVCVCVTVKCLGFLACVRLLGMAHVYLSADAHGCPPWQHCVGVCISWTY